MKILVDAYKNSGDLHHAYFIEGERSEVLPELFSFIEKQVKIPTKAYPDFYHREYENFGIGDSRELKQHASRKAVAGDKKIFVLAFNTITHEAQNALLKLFEEPTPGTHFFIVSLNTDTILPTLKSRMFIVSSALNLDKKNIFSKTFLNSSYAERLELIKEIAENKEKNRAVELLNELEVLVYKQSQKNGFNKENVKLLREIEKTKGYMTDRAPSIKMLLEHIALLLPTQQK